MKDCNVHHMTTGGVCRDCGTPWSAMTANQHEDAVRVATPPTPDPRERGEAEPTLLEAHTLLAVIEKRDSLTLSLAEAQEMNRLVRDLRALARGVTVTEEMVDRAFVSFAGCGAPHFTADDIQRWRDDLRSALTAALTPDAEGGA